jgi:hypothetical protein
MNLLINRVIKNWKGVSNIKYQETNFIQNPISHGRRFSVQNTNEELWKKVFLEFNLSPDLLEPHIGNVLMNHYEDNACTHMHTDRTIDGYVHVRANVMLKKPKKGGDMIIEDSITPLEKNDLWLILASLENHGSTPIQEGERLVYSFGALIKEDKVSKIIS